MAILGDSVWVGFGWIYDREIDFLFVVGSMTQINSLIKPALKLATYAVAQALGQDSRELLEATCCEIHLKQVDDVVTDVEEAVVPMFEEQITAIARGILDIEKRGGIADEKTAGETGLSWVDMVFRPVEWDAVLVDRILPPLAVNMGRAAMAQLEVMGFGGLRRIGVRATSASEWLQGAGDLISLEDVVFDTPYGDVSMRIATEWPEWMKREIKVQLDNSFAKPYWRKVNETTRRDVGRHIERGLLEGRSIESMARSMQNDLLEEGRYALRRGRTIARTESGNALNGARKMSIDNLAAELGPEVPLVASWLSVLGNTTRDTHANLHGVIANADRLWSLGGVMIPWPSHTSLPVGERANCLCTILHEFGATPGTGLPVGTGV